MLLHPGGASRPVSRPLRPMVGRSMLVLAAALVMAACLPSGFADRTTQRALVQPTSMAFTPDGRLFVAEQRGTIEVYDSVDDRTPQLVADLRVQVQNVEDHGLLGIEVDRKWPTRPYVYILYSYDAPVGGTAPTYGGVSDDDPCPDGVCPAQDRIARLTAGPGLQLTDLKVLAQDVCLPQFFHAGGGLRQGADGSLVASIGDGSLNTPTGLADPRSNPCHDAAGESGHFAAQDIRTPADPTGLAGSVIRIDPDTGAAWPTNPNVASGDLNARKIIGYGLRNPYRLTVRPGTSEPWIADVGSAYAEEINRALPGPAANFGWPCFERTERNPDTESLHNPLCTSLAPSAQTPPYYSYCHADQGPQQPCGSGSAAISALEFYAGGAYGARYQNALFFADYTRHTISAMLATNGLPDPTKVETFAWNIGAPVDLRLGPNGDLFYIDVLDGTVHRLIKG